MYFADAMGEDAKVMKMTPIIGGWVSKAKDFLIFAGTYLLTLARNLASAIRRVFRARIIFITFASSPIASAK